MSFNDYGLNIFPLGSGLQDDVLRLGEDCPLSRPGCCQNSLYRECKAISLENSCYHVVVDHLIDLGTCTENELLLVKRELDRYKKLILTDEQINSLQSFDDEKDEAERLTLRTMLDKVTPPSPSRNLTDATSCCPCKNDFCRKESSKIEGIPVSQTDNGVSGDALRMTIIQKDSEIISLKNDSAAKETEMIELEEQVKRLRVIIEELKNKRDMSESYLRVLQAKLKDVVLQTSEEIEILKGKNERLERELRDERELRKRGAEEMELLIRGIQSSRKSAVDELKAMKRQVEMAEATKASQEALVKHQLQFERESLERQRREQEKEIGRFLEIIKRLTEADEESKADLSSLRRELAGKEQKVSQCREQLEETEREVSRLTAELAECLGRFGADESREAELSPPEVGGAGPELCSRARQLTRGLGRLLGEHAGCREQRLLLTREVDRLSRQLATRHVEKVERVKHEASRELDRLKRLVLGTELLLRVDKRKAERVESAYSELASEASLALDKLVSAIGEHDVYRKREGHLILELERFQEAVNYLDTNSKAGKWQVDVEHCHRDRGAELEQISSGDCNYPPQSGFFKNVLQRVRNSTQIVVRISTALRDESEINVSYKKELESQLEDACSVIKELSVEKYKLQSNFEDSEKQRQELLYDWEKLKEAFEEKTRELQADSNGMLARVNSYADENEQLRNKVTAVEKELRESRAQNLAHVKRKEQVIDRLRKEIKAKELKIKEYCKCNEKLNAAIGKSNEMIQRLQATIIQESTRKVDLDSFTMLRNKILELDKGKEELMKKIDFQKSIVSSYERSNSKMQENLAKILEDNDHLEKHVQVFKSENHRLEENIARQSCLKTNLCARCDAVLEKLANFSRQTCTAVPTNLLDIHELENKLENLKPKLIYQEKELLAKDEEIQAKNQQIEQLNSLIGKGKEENAVDGVESLAKRIDILDSEKAELKNELKQTSIKYEEKLAEMQKQYKQNEIELRDQHNDSIMRLEAKMLEMLNEENKVHGSPNGLQNLKQLRALPDRICKTPQYSRSTFERDVFEEQIKKDKELKSTVSNYSARRALGTRKGNTQCARPINANTTSKSSSRQRALVREISSSLSIDVPEKEYPLQPVRNVSVNKAKL